MRRLKLLYTAALIMVSLLVHAQDLPLTVVSNSKGAPEEIHFFEISTERREITLAGRYQNHHSPDEDQYTRWKFHLQENLQYERG